MATTHVNERVQKHRQALRMAGLRPVQIWVPDTRKPGFKAECKRQAILASKADLEDKGVSQLMDDAFQNLDGWSE